MDDQSAQISRLNQDIQAKQELINFQNQQAQNDHANLQGQIDAKKTEIANLQAGLDAANGAAKEAQVRSINQIPSKKVDFIHFQTPR